MPSALFFGSKPGSVVAFNELIKANWDIRKVVVSETIHYDWYGLRTLESEALKNGIEVIYQKESLKEENVDYVISYMFRHRIVKEVLDKAKVAAINFHPAPLPEFGGWGTYNRAILNDSNYFGCTCHYMSENFDEGDLIKVRKFEIDSSKLTAIELENITQLEMLKLFIEIVGMIEKEIPLVGSKQNKIENSYLSFEEMENLKIISSGMSAVQIEKVARAFWFPPHRGAFFQLGESRIEIVPEAIKRKWILEKSENFLEFLISEVENHKKLP